MSLHFHRTLLFAKDHGILTMKPTTMKKVLRHQQHSFWSLNLWAMAGFPLVPKISVWRWERPWRVKNFHLRNTAKKSNKKVNWRGLESLPKVKWRWITLYIYLSCSQGKPHSWFMVKNIGLRGGFVKYVPSWEISTKVTENSEIQSIFELCTWR